jgi:hypothetical protein
MPEDVRVGSPRGAKRCMLQLPLRLTANDVAAIAGAASRPATWRDARWAGAVCPCGGTLVERVRRRHGARFLDAQVPIVSTYVVRAAEAANLRSHVRAEVQFSPCLGSSSGGRTALSCR